MHPGLRKVWLDAHEQPRPTIATSSESRRRGRTFILLSVPREKKAVIKPVLWADAAFVSRSVRILRTDDCMTNPDRVEPIGSRSVSGSDYNRSLEIAGQQIPY